MLTTIKGYYEHGQIILKEESPVTEKTEVMITFLTEGNGANTSKQRIQGGLKGRVPAMRSVLQIIELLA